MDIDFKAVEEIINNFPEELVMSTASIPAAEHLFQVHDQNKAKQLPEEQAIIFHHNVAKLLFVSSRARGDIQTGVTFQSTRVTMPDEDD